MSKTIVMFGDSITHTGSGEVPAKQHWPVLLQQWLGRDGHDVRVINSGVGGHTTEQGLARIDRDVLAHRPDVVFVEFGFNDNHVVPGADGPRVGFDDYVANLRKIVTLTQQVTHAKVVLIANHPTTAEEENPAGSGKYKEKPQHYNRGVRRVAKEMGLLVCDLHAAFADREHPLEELVIADGLHLSAEGARRYAEVVYDFIVKNGLTK